MDTKHIDVALNHVEWYIRTTKMEIKEGTI